MGELHVTTLDIQIPEIPHGHGLSFKKGIADGLLECQEHIDTCHKTHSASYERGLIVGATLRAEIAKLVKP